MPQSATARDVFCSGAMDVRLHWPCYYSPDRCITRRRKGQVRPYNSTKDRRPAWDADLTWFPRPRFQKTVYNIPIWLLHVFERTYMVPPGVAWKYVNHEMAHLLMRYHCFAWSYLHHGSFQKRKPPCYSECLAMRAACRVAYELTTSLRRRPFTAAQVWFYLDVPDTRDWSQSDC